MEKTMDMNKDEFKEWRKECGITQEQAAQYLGLCVGTIRNYEQGLYPVSTVTSLACKWLDYVFNKKKGGRSGSSGI